MRVEGQRCHMFEVYLDAQRPYGLKSMPFCRSDFGFHLMSSPCAKGATASGGVTFMHAVSFLMPSTCFIACLLFA